MTARRLAAIIAADVAGYSRLMHADQERTHAEFTTIMKVSVEPALVGHGGRLVKSTGDGFLAEFPSAVEAVRCALHFQEDIARRTTGDAPHLRLAFRVGVHLGDVIVEEHDIYGDGVNVAARLEALAEPGGIVVSGVVYENVRGRISCTFEDLGDQTVKNIANPVRIYRILSERARIEPKQALAMPDKPSIAVLPFQNISGDPEQEYFVYGIVEEIITGLSRVRSFFVIARNSSFAYRGKSPDVRQVGRELGVRYVLEGSVRKAGNRVRITGQLVDQSTRVHVWADRFDGALEDVFEMQDRVTSSVVSAIEPNIRLCEIERAKRKPPQSLEAYDLVLRAQSLLYSYTRERHAEASHLVRRAIEIDPKYALAAVSLAHCHFLPCQQGWTEARQPLDEVVRLINVGLELGGEDADVRARATFMIAFAGGDLRGALALIEKSLALNPSSGYALTAAGAIVRLRWGQRAGDGLPGTCRTAQSIGLAATELCDSTRALRGRTLRGGSRLCRQTIQRQRLSEPSQRCRSGAPVGGESRTARPHRGRAAGRGAASHDIPENAEVCRTHGISPPTFCAWKAKYGGMGCLTSGG